MAMAADMRIENIARARKQEVIFSILKSHAKSGEDIFGDGVLEILQDGFGFLRSSNSSYLAGPDDIYVSPNIIKITCRLAWYLPQTFFISFKKDL